MTDNLTVAEYSAKHKEACADLFYRVYSNPPYSFDWLDKGKSLGYLTDLESMPTSLGFVLADEGVVIGACFGHREDHFINPAYRINEFFIEPSRQRAGLGTIFMNEMENRLRGAGLKVMYLFTQRHMHAFSFYRKNDFIPNDETVHMAKAIRPESSVVYARTYLGPEH